jgi:hypothetical protein
MNPHHHPDSSQPAEHRCGEGRCGHATHKPSAMPSTHAHHGAGWKGAASVTLHCLTGCLIGEWLGLAVGVALALPTTATVVLATMLAYVSGFALTLWPLLRGGTAFGAALKIVFVGEAVSIGVMEVAMNVVDYGMGGMVVKSLFVARYWEALAAAAVAGFAAAWPVNAWLMSRNLKKCH